MRVAAAEWPAALLVVLDGRGVVVLDDSGGDLVDLDGARPSATVPAGLSISSFTVDIASTMSQFKSLAAAATKGASSLQIGVILPDTTSSTRWVDFDAPYLKQAFTDAGFTSSQFQHRQRAGQRRDRAERRDRRHQPGCQGPDRVPARRPDRRRDREARRAKGVTLIAYDRAIFQGSNTYYVSFNNEKVGELIGKGFNRASRAGRSPSPQVYVLNGGEDTDPNAISFATGYNKVVFNQAGQDGRRGREGHRCRRHAGCRELRSRVGQHQGRHDLPAGVHRQPEDQRHHRGQ